MTAGQWATLFLAWLRDQIAFEIVDERTDDPVMTIVVTTPAGVLSFLAEPVEAGSTLLLQSLHVEGPGPGRIGAGNLNAIVPVVIERMAYDGIIVEGAVRTTGASQGRRPRSIRFSRRVHPETPRT